MMSKTIDYYMELPYTIELTPDLEEGWFVTIKELPGCMSQGETAEEALEMIQDAMRGWIEVELEDGQRGVFIGSPAVADTPSMLNAKIANIWFSNIQFIPAETTLPALIDLINDQSISGSDKGRQTLQ